MGASRPHFYFSRKIRITEAKNLDLVQPTDTVFLRLYLSAGNTSQKIQLNTQDLPSPSSSSSHWNESSLECSGNEDSMKALRQESIVFELQTQRKPSILGPIGGQSRVVGRAEVPWRTVLESSGMEMETWVRMGSPSRGRLSKDVKPLPVRITTRLRIADVADVDRRERTREARLKMTGYRGCDNCGLSLCSREDYDEFVALAAAVDAF